MPAENRHWWAAAILVVLAVKAAVFVQLWQHPLLEPAGETDGAYYRHFAEMVAKGDLALSSKDSYFGQPPSAFFIAPLYIYFLVPTPATGVALVHP